MPNEAMTEMPCDSTTLVSDTTTEMTPLGSEETTSETLGETTPGVPQKTTEAASETTMVVLRRP